MIWRLVRPLLFQLPPERAHELGSAALRALGRPSIVRRRPRAEPSLAVEALGLRFEHPLGLAAGFDKGEVMAPGLFALGFSHVEIGTLTPRPQPGNPPPRMFRLPEHAAIINRMGFNNRGAQDCAQRLSRLAREQLPGVVGINVGRNKDTPNERAEDDYLACIDRLHPFADYLVVNISSPNTPGLRELQARAALERLLGACVARARALPTPKPLLVKLAPDLSPEALDEAVDVALAAGTSGIIATNTTLQRPGATANHPRAMEAGGLSGAPLGPLALEALRRIAARAKGRIPVIGVGGAMNAQDVYARLRAGASLVQVYTGFIYGGPLFPKRILAELPALLARDGFSRAADAIGADLS